MTKKLVCASFDKESVGGFITINNGVGWGKNGHLSKTVAVTRDTFLQACKNRLLFNDILGINIAEGWQNAISDAISNFKNLTEEEFNVADTAKMLIDTDIKVRGEEEVAKDLEPIVQADENLTAELKKIVKKTTKKAKNGKSDKSDGKGTETASANDGKDTGSADDSGASIEESGTADNV